MEGDGPLKGLGMASDLDRFEVKFQKQPDGCWVWIAGKKGGGYGVFYLNGRLRGAHRASLFLYKNLPIDTPLDAMHSCDNPACVNPDHLSYGTRTDNMRDAARKGRTVRVGSWAGSLNPRSKLSAKQLESLQRDLSQVGACTKALAEKYGISRTRVQQINKAKTKKEGGGWALEEF